MKNFKKGLKRLTLLTLVLSIFTFSFTGCALLGSEDEQKADTETQSDDGLFVIRMPKPTGFMTNIIADDLGYFKEEGIKIEFVGDTGKITGFQLIEQGLVDAVYSHPDSVVQARIAGADVKGVAPDVVDNEKIPHVQYLVSAKSDIKSLEDVKDKKFAIASNVACYDEFPQYYLIKHGVETDKINWVTLATPGQMEQSLDQGLVHVVASHPPYAGKALASGTVRKIATSWDIFHSPGTGLYMSCFSSDFIKAHPKEIQGYVNAMYKTRLWVDANLDEAKKIVSKYLDLKTEDISSFYYDTNKNVDPKYVDEWFELCETIGKWKEGDIAKEDIYTNEFVPKDQPELEAQLKLK
jgi:ABC-type nitrate/sulfonate/bicarbonate transport system substrate-binding protein